MKRNEAIQRLAAILKEQAENAVDRAKIALGEHGKIEPADVDYTLKATELLDDAIVEAGFNLAVFGTSYTPDEVSIDLERMRQYVKNGMTLPSIPPMPR